MNDHLSDDKEILTTLDAFDCMRRFIEAYWERGGGVSSDIALLLTMIDRNESEGLPPGDIAQWEDWKNIVSNFLISKPHRQITR